MTTARLAAAPAERRVGVTLAGAIVLALALAMWPWLRPLGSATVDAASERPSAAVAGLALPPLDQFRETAERPLFAPSRRPSATIAPAAAPLGFRLDGVIIMGAQKRAIIKQADGRTARVGEGDKIGEWVVRQIESDRVVLAAGERRLELTPHRGRSGGASPR
jgi:hypothetical protein